jgi:serpin B
MASIRTVTAFGALTTLLAAGACGSSQGAGGVRTLTGKARPVAASALPLGAADTAFGLNVLKAWCQGDPKGDFVFSPTSLADGLGMAYLGARGRTATAMAGALGLTGSPAQILAGMRARTRALDALDSRSTTATRVDQIWADRSVPTLRTFLDDAATGYQASLKSLDMEGDPEGARKTINASVGKDTRGLIPQLMSPGEITKDTGWVLTDATYLKARWAQAFEKETSKGLFTTADGRSVTAQYLKGSGTYGLARIPGWTAVSLPYAGTSLSALALLPDGSGCPALTGDTLDRITTALRPAQLELSLPQATISDNQDMVPLLKSLGMGQAFGDSADFTGLSPRAGKIQFVQHAAVLKINSQGTEGAAATSVGITAMAGRAPIGEPITFDRPYLFIVRDTHSGEPVFIARITDPTG